MVFRSEYLFQLFFQCPVAHHDSICFRCQIDTGLAALYTFPSPKNIELARYFGWCRLPTQQRTISGITMIFLVLSVYQNLAWLVSRQRYIQDATGKKSDPVKHPDRTGNMMVSPENIRPVTSLNHVTLLYMFTWGWMTFYTLSWNGKETDHIFTILGWFMIIQANLYQFDIGKIVQFQQNFQTWRSYDSTLMHLWGFTNFPDLL